MDGDEEREEELSSLTAIFPEIEVSAADKYSFTLEIPMTPAQPLKCRFSIDGSTSEPDAQEHTIAHLPSLQLHMTFPAEYPAEKAPIVKLSTSPPWLPASKLSELETQAKDTWEQYGRSQMAYDYIDSLQQAAERVFDLATKNKLVLLPTFKDAILSFDRKAQKETFDASTFDCGVCLDPKKGKDCHKMHKCGHVFCKDCLQSAYEGAITGGDVSNVKCLEPDCGVERDAITKRATRAAPTLGPDELAEIPILPATVLRYVKLKRKKRFESFPSTVYCPRKWCQGVARDKRYPRKAIENMTAADLEPENILAEADAEPTNLRNNEERLRLCEDCELAFCRVCLATWHGEYVRQCWPRTADELTEDELATRSYLVKNTSPCPTCSFAIQKSMGCNHITCFNCRGHFCYLCSAWLDPSNPYEHFNKPGSSCHQRLWDMEGGDNGDGNFQGIRGAEIQAALAQEEAEAEALQAQPQAVDQAQAQNPPAEAAEANLEAAEQALQNLNLNHDPEPAPVPQNPAIAAFHADMNALLENINNQPENLFDDEDEDWFGPPPRANWRNEMYQPQPAGRPRQPRRPGVGDWARNRGEADWGDGYGNQGGGLHVRQRRNLRGEIEREARDARGVDGGEGVGQRRRQAARNVAQRRNPGPVAIPVQAQAQARAIAAREVVAQQPRNQEEAERAAVAGLQRFLQMAAEDREDEWDSDELEGEDDVWAIPDAPVRPAGEGFVRMPFLMARR